MRGRLSGGELGPMTASEVLQRVLAAVVLATMTGLATAMLMSQAQLPGAGAIDYLNQGPAAGTTVIGGTIASGTTLQLGFVVTEPATRPAERLHATSVLRWITITNNAKVDLRVTRLTALVRRPAGDTGCVRGDLAVEPLDLPLLLSAGKSRDVAVVTRLNRGAPPGCGQVHFPITYTGIAHAP